MAGRNGNRAGMSSKSPVSGKFLPVIIQHCIVIQLDHHGIGDIGDIRKDRPSGKSAVIRDYTHALIFISLFIAGIDHRRVSGMSVSVSSDPQALVVDLCLLADDRDL